MARIRQRKLKCVSVLQRNKSYKGLRNQVKFAALELGFYFEDFSITRTRNYSNREGLEAIQESDIIVIDAKLLRPDIFYELGIAQASGKHIIYLVDESLSSVPGNLRSYSALAFDASKRNYDNLGVRLKTLILDLLKAPRKKSLLEVSSSNVFRQPHVIDLENLDLRTFENLCYELLVQMGYRQVEWEKSSDVFDMLAVYPKKDPDGFEYGEQWLVSISNNIKEKGFRRAELDPLYLIDRLLRDERSKRIDTQNITFLFISKNSRQSVVSNFYRRFYNSIAHKNYRDRDGRNVNVRIRHWTLPRIVQLLNDYPNIVNKYFSDEAAEGSKYRKNYEELYKENVAVTEELQKVMNDLEKEKKLRFIAERDSAWKDVAFKAAHKLGNPIDAVDTFLQSLKKRISDDCKGAMEIANEIDSSVEDAKLVIAQFKSLTKARKIKKTKVDIEPILNHAAMPAREQGVNVTLAIRKNCPKLDADGERLTECFQELFANSFKWFHEKGDKNVSISVIKPTTKKLPEVLNKSEKYLKISFKDNGQGVPYKLKEIMFSPFVTKSVHGAGLGLALVQSIIEKHGGLIYEDGVPGKGAQFQIFLPISK